jgi:hypothetical protein
MYLRPTIPTALLLTLALHRLYNRVLAKLATILDARPLKPALHQRIYHNHKRLEFQVHSTDKTIEA